MTLWISAGGRKGTEMNVNEHELTFENDNSLFCPVRLFENLKILGVLFERASRAFSNFVIVIVMLLRRFFSDCNGKLQCMSSSLLKNLQTWDYQ